MEPRVFQRGICTVATGRFLNRRRFLQAVGAAGGAGAVLASMEVLGLVPDAAEHTQAFRAPRTSDFHLRCRTNDTTVVVLGAGDAGLAAAYELGKAGYRCEILEARARPGGRCWTVRGGQEHTDLGGAAQTARFADGLYMNAGPARIPQHHTTLDYCRELGVPIEVFINSNPDAFLFHAAVDGATGPLTGRPLRRRAVKADYAGYVSELLAKCTTQGALDTALTPDDREALIEYLRSLGVLNDRNRYLGSANRGYETPPGEGDAVGTVGAPYQLPDLLASGLGMSFAFDEEWDQAMPMFQPVGGMDRIPFALAAAQPGLIRYEAAVQRIQVRDDRVDVDYVDPTGTYRVSADYCICTIPPTVLRKIANNFPTDVTSALGALGVMPVGKIGLQYARRFWEEDDRIFGGISDTNLDIGTIFYPSYGFHGERGVLIGYYNYFDDSTKYAAMPPRERERRALDQGAKVHGDVYRREFESSFSVHWQNERFSEGGWVLWQGQNTPTYTLLLKPVGRLYFAGDHLSQVTAWQHGAFESARYAVTHLHDRVIGAASECAR
jgi:monoamine oxidase